MEANEFRQRAERVASYLEKEWFFVVGFEKSGTTWMQKMLNAHPKTTCLGEGHFIRHIGQPLQDAVNMFNQVISITNQNVYGNKNVDYKTLDVDDLRAAILMSVLPTIIEPPKEETVYFGDKTPSNILFLGALSTLFPKAKFFHIIRDPRDVLVSFVKHMQRTDPQKNYTYEGSAETVAKAWNERVKFAQTFGSENLKGQYHELRYEDALTDPAGELKKMHRFLGLESTDAEIAECVEKTSFETLSGGRKKGEENRESFFRKGVSGEWEDELSEEVVNVIEEHAGQYLRILKYAA